MRQNLSFLEFSHLFTADEIAKLTCDIVQLEMADGDTLEVHQEQIGGQ